MQGNSLKNIIEEYPGVWKEAKKFKALLLDYYPEDKMVRNLILLCNDEGIPYDLEKEKYINELRLVAYSKRLITACGCTIEKAQEIVNIWVEALGIIVIDDSSEQEVNRSQSIDELELSVRAYNVVKREGINTVGDLLDARHNILSIRGLGRKGLIELAEKLDNLGYDAIQFIKVNKLEDNPLKQLLAAVQFGAHKEVMSGFEKTDNHRMTIIALEKAVLDGFRGDFSPAILAYMIGEYGVDKNIEKAAYYAKKWYELYEEKELADYPSIGNCILILYFLSGYTTLDECIDDENRTEKVKSYIDELIGLSSLLSIDNSDDSINSVLTAVGLGFASGEMEYLFNETRYSIGKDLPKAIQALTIASNRGNMSATKCLIMAYLDSEMKGNTYNSLREAYQMLVSQNQEEAYKYMDDLLSRMQFTDDDKPKLTSLKIRTETKKKLFEKNLQTYDDLQAGGVKQFIEDNNLTDDNLIDLMVGIGRFVKE